MDAPKLIDGPAKNYLFQTLQKCHNNRVTIYYYGLNIGIFLLFVLVVGLVLYYCKKNKLTDYEKQQKIMRDQNYVLSKIRYYQDEVKTKQANVSGITQLPVV